MSPQRSKRIRARKRPNRLQEQVLIAARGGKGRKADTVALQWLDGAGELHYETLSPAQSWPYLVER